MQKWSKSEILKYRKDMITGSTDIKITYKSKLWYSNQDIYQSDFDTDVITDIDVHFYVTIFVIYEVVLLLSDSLHLSVQCAL